MSHPSIAGLRRLPAPVAWVFTGGFARAAAQVGMAEVLLEQGLAPDMVVGSSTGAINAAALTESHPHTHLEHLEHLEQLRATWRLIGTESLLASLGAAAVRAFAPRRTGRSVREFRQILATAIPGGDEQVVPPHLTLVASDLARGEAVCLTSGRTIDALLASTCMPVILQPVERDGTLLLDGGMTASAPLDQALERGAGSVVMFDTGASAVPEDAVAEFRWWQIAALAYGHQIRGQLGHALVRVAEEIPVVTFATDSGGQFDFTHPDDLFDAGRSAASHALAHGLGASADASAGVYGIPPGYEDDPRLTPLRRR